MTTGKAIVVASVLALYQVPTCESGEAPSATRPAAPPTAAPLVEAPIPPAPAAAAPTGGAGAADPEPDPRPVAPSRLARPTGSRPVPPGFAACQTDADPPGCAIGLLDPSGHALASFAAALARAESGGRARVAVFGASHTAGDVYVHEVRKLLQRRYGDGGHGFVMPCQPYRGYRHLGVELGPQTGEWTGARIGARGTGDSQSFGLGGASVESAEAGATCTVRNAPRGPVGGTFASIDVGFLRQEGGGAFTVKVDGADRVTLSTGGAGVAYERLALGDGPHTVEFVVGGSGPVRLLGVSLERPSGVIVDTLGLNGARAASLLRWDEAAFRAAMQRASPDLVILAYGTNESGDDEEPIERYERTVDAVLTRVRSFAPGASCLLIGPSDRAEKQTVDGVETAVPLPRVQEVSDAQYRAAAVHGCAFFDLARFTGPPGGMAAWAEREPPFAQDDLVHFSRAGYLRLGEVFGDALMRGLR